MSSPRIDPQSVRLVIDGVEHYAEWHGRSDAYSPVIILLHDGLGCIANWRGFPDGLWKATGWPVFAYDRWGYGQSARREAFPDGFMEEEAARLSKILDAAGIDDCVLVGHSDGGTISLLHAADRPPRIRGLVTIAAHVTVDPTAAVYLEELDALLAAGTPPPWMKRFHGERGPHLLACWTETWRREFANGWNIVSRLAPIEAPLLVLQGANDPYKIPAHLDLIAGAVPGAESMLLDGLGHFPHLEHPETVIREIVRFIDRADVRPSRR